MRFLDWLLDFIVPIVGMVVVIGGYVLWNWLMF